MPPDGVRSTDTVIDLKLEGADLAEKSACGLYLDSVLFERASAGDPTATRCSVTLDVGATAALQRQG